MLLDKDSDERYTVLTADERNGTLLLTQSHKKSW